MRSLLQSCCGRKGAEHKVPIEESKENIGDEDDEAWAPKRLTAEPLPKEECFTLYGEEYGVWLFNEGDDLWSAWQYRMATDVHGGGEEASGEWLREYTRSVRDAVLAGLDFKHWALEVGKYPCEMAEYLDWCQKKPQFKNESPEEDERLEATKYETKQGGRIVPDVLLRVRRVVEGRWTVVATPIICEGEATHRNLWQSVGHSGELVTKVRKANVFMCEKINYRNEEGGLFSAIYYELRRIFDAPGGDDDAPAFKVARLRQFGTRPYNAQPKTKSKMLQLWRRYNVTEIMGMPLEPSTTTFEFESLDQHQHDALRDALDGNAPTPPDDLREWLQFDVPADAIFPPGPRRQQSGPLRVDLYDLLRRATRGRATNFAVLKRSASEADLDDDDDRSFY